MAKPKENHKTADGGGGGGWLGSLGRKFFFSVFFHIIIPSISAYYVQVCASMCVCVFFIEP